MVHGFCTWLEATSRSTELWLSRGAELNGSRDEVYVYTMGGIADAVDDLINARHIMPMDARWVEMFAGMAVGQELSHRVINRKFEHQYDAKLGRPTENKYVARVEGHVPAGFVPKNGVYAVKFTFEKVVLGDRELMAALRETLEQLVADSDALKLVRVIDQLGGRKALLAAIEKAGGSP